MDPLKNVIWQALSTRQLGFAETFDQARKFPKDVTSLGGLPEPDDRSYESLVGLLRNGDVAALFLEAPYQAHSGLKLVADAPLLEMVWADGKASSESRTDGEPAFVEL